LAPGGVFFVLSMATIIAGVVSHLVAAWVHLPTPNPAYRRIGPVAGPQVLCAGSSLLQFGLSWPEISETLGQGIESWGLGGSTPLEWEVFQGLATNTNLMIMGVSVYDLNEHHLCSASANVVPLAGTIRHLRGHPESWPYARHLLGQYPLAYLRKLFPTAGNSDAVLVGLRRKLPTRLRAAAAEEDRSNSLVLPSEPVLNFGGSTEKVSDWSRSKTLRRLASMRSENQGMHAFNGPKKLAFERMLLRAQQRGRVIVVILPVSPAYTHEFLAPEVIRNFENALAEAQRADPQAEFVRLDEISALNSDDYYGDLVHLNGAGRQIATEAFLGWLRQKQPRA
jgi:hypothetical protein